MDSVYPDIWLFTPGKGASAPEEETAYREESADDEEKIYRCTMCGQDIAYEKERQLINGKPEHTFTNPHGYVFTIGSFSRAHGCSSAGPLTNEFTWFAGYAWRYVLCSGCRSHLGWEFSGDRDFFYGLIMNRIVLE